MAHPRSRPPQATTVSLTWTGVDGAATYTVVRDGGAATAPGIVGTAHTVAGLTSGTNYTFAVQAVGSAGGQSALSSPVVATTTGVPPPIAAPRDVRVTATTASTVALAWTAATGAVRYVVVRDGTEAFNVTATAAPTATDTALAPETTYEYVLVAVDASDRVSPASEPVTATTRAAFECQSYEDNNFNHVAAGRAYTQLGYAYAVGSGDLLGLYNTFYRSTLSETAPEYFIVGTCPPRAARLVRASD